MADEPRRADAGWTLGASGLPKPFWGFMAFVLVVVAVVLLVAGYIGYGALMLVVAAAAAVNLL